MESLIKCGCSEFPNNHSTRSNRREDTITRCCSLQSRYGHSFGISVQSQIATRFRRWATQRLHEYIQKGFAMDDERLKQGGTRYFRELLQRIRDIRSSE